LQRRKTAFVLCLFLLSEDREEQNMSVTFEYIHKAFDEVQGQPKYVLKDVNLKIKTGEFICVLGKSGCGKSTLLNLLAGYLKPDKGRILVDGEKVDGPSAQRGVVFQQHALFPWYTVKENIEFGLKLQKRLRQSIFRLLVSKAVKMLIRRSCLAEWHSVLVLPEL
jgi:ABC-type taurine transport system ATPase subunit